MGRSLVEDDPDPVFEQPNLDERVVEKGQTFWGFLSSIFGGIAGFTRKVSGSKTLKNLNSQIWYGEAGKGKPTRRCSCGGRILSNGHCMFCGKKG
jgi:hypothetical protein